MIPLSSQHFDVAVIGGGNVAMDSARTALRLGAEKSTIVYRRSEVEMPARNAEIHHAKQEGIEFRLLCNPVAVLADRSPETVVALLAVLLAGAVYLPLEFFLLFLSSDAVGDIAGQSTKTGEISGSIPN